MLTTALGRRGAAAGWLAALLAVLLSAAACGRDEVLKGSEPSGAGGAAVGGHAAIDAGGGAGTSGEAGRGGAETDGGAVGGGDGGPISEWFYGTDCAESSLPSVPADSPRILILGPEVFYPIQPTQIPAVPTSLGPAIAAHLQGMLASDFAFTAPEVTGLSIKAFAGGSLMNFFYAADGRDARLAALSQPWSYVVLLEQFQSGEDYPEFYFEGVRVLGCSARAAGAKPIVLMPWSLESGDAGLARRGELAYRVANGTNSIVAPAGYAWAVAKALADPVLGRDDVLIAAATLYSTLTGRDASQTSYHPADIPAEHAAELATIAFDSVVFEAKKVHYQDPYQGVVERRTLQSGGDLWFMDSGTSSEQIWFDRINEILPKAGLAPEGTQIGVTNLTKTFDDACLVNAMPYFQKQQYQMLFARDYAVDAATIAAAGAQSELQIQVWDRHADFYSSDGADALNNMESMLHAKAAQAEMFGLALVPNHLMFAKLKTMRPSVQLLSDGTHATYPVGYGLATMSVVSRTGIHVPIDGLDSDTQLAATLAEETIHQLATLSVSGAFVPDDPNTRPSAP